ncbi:MAG TPA: CAP domain-containing protein [Solirubrobacteraceae bacterium]
MRTRLARMAAMLIAAGALAGAGTSVASAAPCAHASDVPTADSVGTAQRATLCLLNRVRHAHHLKRLRTNRSLQGVSQKYSQSMVVHDFFDHVSAATGLDLVQRIQQTPYLTGVGNWVLGENLAWGSGDLATPAKIMDAWMHSAGHRHNILTGRFREIGIGIAIGAPVPLTGNPPAATYTTDFGQHG